ncbi:biotin transport system substrate-specific component [Pullulanibacillus pueri]|uniref:Biotin transporter n=2 Tax=Pullulanibacillus pueri TaxID=1437324 RepID=A0A8J3EKV1_9BACL|nr:biotin transport system substrate-specific component [Pullulanibacillus pueri]GGH76905.1 hypothetical protein GCM10007096_08010 [Pullulanibacillus pueri]
MKSREKLKMMIVSALFAAMTAIMAQIEIPLPLVPISGQTFAVGLTATVIGANYGALAMILYAALGAIGLPVFAQFSAGFSVIVGPTGGYIVSFIISAFIIGFILERTRFNFTMAIIANIIGMIMSLILGTIQLKYVADLSWHAAMVSGVYPFLIVGVIKAVLSAVIGILARKRLLSAHLLS